ncbi:IS256 family transposase [uncultured Rubinisphaera sp.]|uniref:IS256 family transposase n=1 Tax=uncultured Rubinisphaera sp. TaxID=1678686 RepID=UPI0030DD86BB
MSQVINSSSKNTTVSEADLVSDVMTQILKQGAQQMLKAAIEAEVQEYLEIRQKLRDEQGHRLVVRNGRLPERELMTGLGPIPVQQPRVRDKRSLADREEFSSKILPKYLRKAQSIEELIPWLYLKGISTNDFPEALQALLGPNAKGLSATTITRMKKIWEEEYREWNKRDLSETRYVYFWADGIYSNIRLENDRQCLLVLMGAIEDGGKELVAVVDGVRESKLSWKAVLLELKQRGLATAPKLAIGDGALGFWSALREVFPETRTQRCTVHKTANVLNQLPKKIQPQAKGMLHEIWNSPTKADADKAFDLFVKTFQSKYHKATDCLEKDREELLTYYDFPAENWCHIRTTNPIESTFATIRLRHKKTRGCGSAMASLTMMFKLAQSASKNWRRLRGHDHFPELLRGVKFIDGIHEAKVNTSRTNKTTTQPETAA